MFEPTERNAELVQAIERRVALTSDFPLFTFKPNPVQWRFIDNDDSKILAIIGANKVGKSTAVATEGNCHALGIRPYLPQEHEHFRVRMPNGDPMPVPNIGQIVAEDYPNGVGKVQWPMWEKWLPKGMFEIKKTERGVVREVWVDVSGLPWADTRSPLYPYSRLHFMAYEQGAKKFAGFDPHWILNDEPPPKDVWIEQMRGLVSTGGKWMGAMTLVTLDQAWIYDIFFPRKKTLSRMATGQIKKDDETELFTSGVKTHVVTGSMRDNLKKEDGSGGLSEKNIRDYEAMLTPEERAVRIQGERIHMVGTTWGGIFDPDIHVVPHREPSPFNPHIMAIDPHPTKEWAILWAELTMDDQIYVWREELVQGTIEDFARTIKEVEGWKPIRGRKGKEGWRENTSPIQPKVRMIDPLAKVNERGVGKSPLQQLAEHELYFIPWRRHNKSTRLRNVTEALKTGFGPSSEPRIQISEQCEELIYEIPMYREKMPQNPETQERKGEMVKVLDDLIDCLVGIVNSPYTNSSLTSWHGPRGREDDSRESTTEAVGGY